MRLLIDGLSKIVTINGVAVSVTSPVLADGIDHVVLHDDGTGGIQKHGAMFREVFSDPSTYQPFVNAWISAMSGLTLAQAKAVKIEFIAAIEPAKRQLPKSFMVDSVVRTWDGSDQAVSSYSLEGGGASVAAVAGSTSAALGSILADLQAAGGPTISAPPVSGPTSAIQVVPYQAAAAVGVSQTGFALIISTFAARRKFVAAAKQSKIAAVNALASVSAVVAYDATIGWEAAPASP